MSRRDCSTSDGRWEEEGPPCPAAPADVEDISSATRRETETTQQRPCYATATDNRDSGESETEKRRRSKSEGAETSDDSARAADSQCERHVAAAAAAATKQRRNEGRKGTMQSQQCGCNSLATQ